MSYYIYMFKKRIVFYREPYAFYSPVTGLKGVTWYLVHQEPQVSFEDMIRQGNYSFSSEKGFFVLDTDDGAEAYGQKADSVIAKIKVLEKFQSLANTQKLRYTNTGAGQSIIDALTIHELQEFRRTGSLDGCTLLSMYLEIPEDGYTPEALATKLWLQFESFKNVIVYLHRIEQGVRKLLDDNRVDEANRMIAQEFEKMRV